MLYFTIPVAMVVAGANEIDAARNLVRLLADRVLTSGHPNDIVRQPPVHIDCWFMPNHSAADGSDGDERVVWIRLR